MKNSDLFEPPLTNIERAPSILILHVLLSVVLDYFVFRFFTASNAGLDYVQVIGFNIHMSIWGFLLVTPAALLTFQSLWLILNPFALIYKDRVEFRYSLFGNRRRYFTDIKKVVKAKDGKTYLIFTDDEAEPLKLFGIRKSHISLLMQELDKQMALARQFAP